jgi:CheY-like chemotaxis protein
MDATLLIADHNARRRNELRRFFSRGGLQVIAVSDGLECLAELVAREPDVLVIAQEIPWGGGDGVIARLNDDLPVWKKPLVLVIGDAPPAMLSALTGVPSDYCFSMPLRKKDLLDRVDTDLALGLVRVRDDQWRRPEGRFRRTWLEEDI